MPRVRANGIDIAYESLGREGDPALLLIHGFATPLTGWPNSLCEGLVSRGLRVVRFDNRDIGRSTFQWIGGGKEGGSARMSRPGARARTWPSRVGPAGERRREAVDQRRRGMASRPSRRRCEDAARDVFSVLVGKGGRLDLRVATDIA